jgi:hypothetical protein
LADQHLRLSVIKTKAASQVANSAELLLHFALTIAGRCALHGDTFAVRIELTCNLLGAVFFRLVYDILKG